MKTLYIDQRGTVSETVPEDEHVTITSEDTARAIADALHGFSAPAIVTAAAELYEKLGPVALRAIARIKGTQWIDAALRNASFKAADFAYGKHRRYYVNNTQLPLPGTYVIKEQGFREYLDNMACCTAVPGPVDAYAADVSPNVNAKIIERARACYDWYLELIDAREEKVRVTLSVEEGVIHKSEHMVVVNNKYPFDHIAKTIETIVGAVPESLRLERRPYSVIATFYVDDEPCTATFEKA